MLPLAGRRALVTGSGRGIGRAIALGLAASGARVAFHDLTTPTELPEPGLAKTGSDGSAADAARAFQADLAVPAEVQRLAAEILDSFGGLDILVLNASIEVREPWDAVSDDAFARQVAINFDATRRLLAALVPGMVAQGWGRLLAIGSVQELREHPQMLIYAALKAAQTSMMRNLARQVAPRGVTCNTLAPGAIATDRNAHALADPDYRAQVVARIPMGEIGHAQDCVGAAIFLCSDAARYVTGIRLPVDGGMHL